MYFQNNITTIYSKSAEKPPQVKIASGGFPQGDEKWGFPNMAILYVNRLQIYVLSEKYENHMLKINEKTPLGQNSPWGSP